MRFRGTKALIKYAIKCSDCESFAVEIDEALRAAGWSTVRLPTDNVSPGIGLSIRVGLSKTSGNDVLGAMALTEVLLNHKFDLGFWSVPGAMFKAEEFPPNTVVIEISPNPFVGILTDDTRENRKRRIDSVRQSLEYTRQQFDLIRQKQD